MKITKFSTLLLLAVLSSCLVLAITYQLSYKTAKQALVSLVIKPRVLNAVVDINPDTLNLKSKGKWITAYIELPEDYNASDIDVSTIRFNDTIPAELHPTGIGDKDRDDIPDLMVKFDRAAVIEYIRDVLGVTSGEVTLTVTGEVAGTLFAGSDTIRVIKPGK